MKTGKLILNMADSIRKREDENFYIVVTLSSKIGNF